jgi:hypothetical protein
MSQATVVSTPEDVVDDQTIMYKMRWRGSIGNEILYSMLDEPAPWHCAPLSVERRR